MGGGTFEIQSALDTFEASNTAIMLYAYSHFKNIQMTGLIDQRVQGREIR